MIYGPRRKSKKFHSEKVLGSTSYSAKYPKKNFTSYNSFRLLIESDIKHS